MAEIEYEGQIFVINKEVYAGEKIEKRIWDIILSNPQTLDDHQLAQLSELACAASLKKYANFTFSPQIEKAIRHTTVSSRRP